jgi:hypothetical protein
MEIKTVSFCSTLLLASLFAPQAHAGDEVSLESLLHDMADREQLTEVPSPHFICRQFSSYDRDTVAEGEDGWFANWDRSQFVRVEETDGRKEYVMLDTDGPGAIVRIWSTWHGPRKEEGGLAPFSNGTLRFYLDGKTEPVIEGPVADLISGGALIGEPFSESVSPESDYKRRGHNLYLPIPYAEGCKITYESEAIIDFGAQKGEALYYQINYRSYEPGTEVKSFAREQLEELAPLIEEVGGALVADELGEVPLVSSNGNYQGKLPPKLGPMSLYYAELEGGAIRTISIRLAAEDLEQALRSTVLTAEFDGEQTIWCPVGDFFGTGYRINQYRSWYTDVTEDGTMICRWVMPHAKSAQVSLINLGDQPVEVNATVRGSRYDWTDRSMHFHATWHQLTKVDTGPNKNQSGEGAFDVNYVTVKGEGVVVGDTLTLFNGTSSWWGEGDEKIYIDGEVFPSHIGTGTEDYYGYAWCRPEYFQSPFHSQPCGDGNLSGGFSVNSRYRVLDTLPFTSSIRFDMELWHWRNTKMNYAPSVFWYARPGATCNVEPDPEAASLPVAKKRSDIIEVRRVAGAIEGESLVIVESTGGTAEVQEVDHGWSGGAQLWWIDGKPGDRLVLEVPVETAGRYRVIADLTKAVDYGIVRLTIGGQASDEFDRYHPAVANDAVELGTFELSEGVNRLEVEIIGANEKAIARHMFGLDYLKLERVED